MKLNALPLGLALSSLLPNAVAWGSLGHETVAYIASNFVASDTKVFFQTILHNKTSSYLAGVATWADSFRYTKAGKFSEPFHFIDAEDSPPSTCGVKYSRDCGEKGCVVGAITNYTSQLLDPSVSESERLMAAKFIVHFLGDIHQPLHDEALDRGGNGIKVTFDGVETNLHHIWDTNMPEKLVGGYKLEFAEEWANTITTSIQSGAYQSIADGWLDGIDVTDPVTTSLAWATEANAFVCTTVLPDGIDGVENQELGGDYYNTAIPVIQLQIARGGYRLARWLDLIASSVQGQEEL